MTGATRHAFILATLAFLSGGCAMVMNGVSDKLTAQTRTPGARVYVDGFDATDHPLIVPNDRPHLILVRAKGYGDRTVVVTPHVKPAPIVLDVLLAGPSLLIAPLLDLSLNWWTAIDSPEQPIDLSPPVAVQRARPAYAVSR